MSSTSLLSSLPAEKQVANLATVGLVGIGYFIIMVVALHFLRSSADPVRQTTSEYAVGSYGLLMTSAFLSMSLACLALAMGLYRGIAPEARARVGLALLGVWVVAVLIVMIFPIDLEGASRTTSHVIHRISGTLGFLSLSVSTVLISRRLKHDEKWRPVHRFALILAGLMLVGFVVTGLIIATDAGYMGLAQRVVLVIFAVWFILVATRLLSVAAKPDSNIEGNRTRRSEGSAQV